MEIDTDSRQTVEEDAEVKEYWVSRTGQPYGDESQPDVPVTIYSLSFDAEQLLAVYGSLRVYLRTLAGQESEDLEMLARVVSLLGQIRPRAVEASKSLALKAAGMISPSS